MVRAYAYKLIHSPSMYIAIIGVIMLCGTNFFTYDFSHGDVVYHVGMFLNVGVYRKVMTVFGAFPFAANFAEEYVNGVTIHCVTHKGAIKYAVANVILCFATALLTVFLGMMLFCGLYALFVPFYVPDGNPYSFIFGQFLANDQGEIYLTLRILVFSVSCAMWSVTGMLLSSILPNKYIAICTPFVASYIVERITIQFPGDLNLWYLSLSFVTFRSDLIGFLYCVGIFVTISVICGIIFVNMVRKRVQNEIT